MQQGISCFNSEYYTLHFVSIYLHVCWGHTHTHTHTVICYRDTVQLGTCAQLCLVPATQSCSYSRPLSNPLFIVCCLSSICSRVDGKPSRKTQTCWNTDEGEILDTSFVCIFFWKVLNTVCWWYWYIYLGPIQSLEASDNNVGMYHVISIVYCIPLQVSWSGVRQCRKQAENANNKYQKH